MQFHEQNEVPEGDVNKLVIRLLPVNDDDHAGDLLTNCTYKKDTNAFYSGKKKIAKRRIDWWCNQIELCGYIDSFMDNARGIPRQDRLRRRKERSKRNDESAV